MHITDKDQLEIGKTYHKVFALATFSYTSSFELISLEETNLGTAMIIDMPDLMCWHKTKTFLSDCNVPVNGHNLHRLYDNDAEAQEYCNKMKYTEHPLNKVEF